MRSIIVTPHERYGVSNHRQLDCLFNSLPMLTKQISKLNITASLLRESTGDGGFPSQSASNAESIPRPLCHHTPGHEISRTNQVNANSVVALINSVLSNSFEQHFILITFINTYPVSGTLIVTKMLNKWC